MICLICQKEFGCHGLPLHVIRSHNISAKDYYDKFIKQKNDGICGICSLPTKFKGICAGYAKACGKKCSSNLDSTKKKREETVIRKYNVKSTNQLESVKQKKIDSCIEHFGTSHHMKNPEFKKKFNNIMISLFGVENVSRLPETQLK